MFSIILILELVLIFNWLYTFYYFYSINQYWCLNLKKLNNQYGTLAFIDNFILYIIINAFKKFYYFISKKNKNFLSFFLFLIIFFLNIPIRSIKFIFQITHVFNIKIFLQCKTKKDFKLYFINFLRNLCDLSYKDISRDNLKIEIFDKKIYY